jgi:hypothetical protein
MTTTPAGQTDNRIIALPAGSVVQKPRFLDGVRSIVRARHYSSRTEKAYISWIRRFIVFHGKRHPSKFASIMDPDENKVELWEPKVWDDKNKGA